MRIPTRPEVRAEDIAEVQAIVDQLTKRKSEKPKEPRWVQNAERTAISLRQVGLIGQLVALVFALFISFAPSSALSNTVFSITMLAVLVLFVSMAVALLPAIPFLVTVFKRPLDPIVELVSAAMKADMDNTNRLSRCNREAVEYVLAHYKHQRQAFELRTSALGGQLEKLGLFPVLATFAAAATALVNSPYQWLRGLVFLVPAFHILKLMSFAITQEMDRTIALLEYSIAARERAEAEEEKEKAAA